MVRLVSPWVVALLLVPSGALAAERPRSGPSCDGGPGAGTDCHGVSCCARGELPAGTFHFVTKPGVEPREMKVAAFELDRFEVTVGRFAAWAKAGSPLPKEGEVLQLDLAQKPIRWTSHAKLMAQRGDRLAGWRKYDTWSAKRWRAPKNSVNWYTAAAFCHWDGGRLPTEIEWQYAAVGGDEQRRYPWGSEAPDLSRAVYNCAGSGTGACDLSDLLDVGSKPKGVARWGHHDMVGSVFEWTVDREGRAGLDMVSKPKGGGFCYIGGIDHRAPPGLTATTARLDKLETISHTVGVRCAYDLPEDGGR
ncbi:MAG: SUMF1/EgtB/PvdO family nonheme iron enzyme [Myxococcales bacterium]|nr:SUMF1/EgtB/PvdO family nonheme iron enzyme [Myxococcales bacterium]